jgi:hypothetical protein
MINWNQNLKLECFMKTDHLIMHQQEELIEIQKSTNWWMIFWHASINKELKKKLGIVVFKIIPQNHYNTI